MQSTNNHPKIRFESFKEALVLLYAAILAGLFIVICRPYTDELGEGGLALVSFVWLAICIKTADFPVSLSHKYFGQLWCRRYGHQPTQIVEGIYECRTCHRRLKKDGSLT